MVMVVVALVELRQERSPGPRRRRSSISAAIIPLATRCRSPPDRVCVRARYKRRRCPCRLRCRRVVSPITERQLNRRPYRILSVLIEVLQHPHRKIQNFRQIRFVFPAQKITRQRLPRRGRCRRAGSAADSAVAGGGAAPGLELLGGPDAQNRLLGQQLVVLSKQLAELLGLLVRHGRPRMLCGLPEWRVGMLLSLLLLFLLQLLLLCVAPFRGGLRLRFALGLGRQDGRRHGGVGTNIGNGAKGGRGMLLWRGFLLL
mmetsp:Transcript_20901/g.58087  ORF Transcript_20901/g.58087 Transcript_20901/m.58087 type:complete len:258 (-) Transcript_20901:559-1332(-)